MSHLGYQFLCFSIQIPISFICLKLVDFYILMYHIIDYKIQEFLFIYLGFLYSHDILILAFSPNILRFYHDRYWVFASVLFYQLMLSYDLEDGL